MVQEMKIELQNIHEALMSAGKTDWELEKFVKTMVKPELQSISACGMVELKPSLILSVFGSLFTYGLLVLNLKNPQA